MLDFSDWTPTDPKFGPPFPKGWQSKWPTAEELSPQKPGIGPPLPSGLKIVWPWTEEVVPETTLRMSQVQVVPQLRIVFE